MQSGMIEQLDGRPEVRVDVSEYRRLLGYPPGHEPAARARELEAWAREWYAENGRPWIYFREAALGSAAAPGIDGEGGFSPALRQYFERTEARRILLVAVSAGAACEEMAGRLWQDSRPDEYFFLEVYGSAVVEHLVAKASGRICALADNDGLAAAPHYSPGYESWDVADQSRLLEVLKRAARQEFPEPLEALTSGMLRPKKSLLGVFALTKRRAGALDATRLVPCQNCSLNPCAYRRAPYRHAIDRAETSIPSGAPRAATAGRPAVNGPAAPGTTTPRYTVNVRALEKWARERIRISNTSPGGIEAVFRFDGTTCSNQGRPLSFEYRVRLGPAEERWPILEARCAPATDDTGHTWMCAYREDATALMAAITAEPPLVGRPLGDVLAWERPRSPSGCYCEPASRAHKWGLVLEAIHYALAAETAGPAAPSAAGPDSAAASTLSEPK